MTAPDRRAEVAALFAQHPGVLDGPPETVDERKRAFLQTIIHALNRVDGGHWGVLVKTDQGHKIPADIIVWRLTMEHFDVLTDSGPMWKAHGVVTNDRWIWRRVTVAPEPEPAPTQPGPVPTQPGPAPTQPGQDFAPILEALRGLSERLDDLRAEALLTRSIVKAIHERHDPTPVTFPVYRNRFIGAITPESRG